ncbi:MAG: selenocysteine-specific translation elongation factor [Eggerthellaceae bacterium]|nr:selenocysteine-specific translation elongation factor [Eggerthellaceae bacterium]
MDGSTQSDLVLGTAGHIDHGKSALIFALTGTDPDRLAEEKERGITITLGFAQLWLPDGRSMSVVDMPGHEKFVRQMISGATGIDVALLVVAADDGVMPQTVEHLTILQTLGIRSCVVALTKIDLVEPDWIEFVTDDVRQHLASTPYADVPIIPVSSKTREGLDDLLLALQDAASAAKQIHSGAAMRYPIDRVFTIKGAGTVLTGTLWSGTASPDDTVEILPSKKVARIRSVQIHGSSVDVAYPGNRVAINLNKVKMDEVQPGDFLASVGAIEPSDRFDAYVTYIDNDKTGKSIVSGAPMHIAHGTREVVGRILFMDGLSALEPGASTIAQFRLEEPLALSFGDRFVMRTYSPVLLAGGGAVMLTHPRRRTNLSDGERVLLDALQADDLTSAVVLAAATEPVPVEALFVARLIGIEPQRAEEFLQAAVKEGRIEVLESVPRYYATKKTMESAIEQISDALLDFHKAEPKEVGLAKEALRRKCFPNMSTACFDALLNRAIALGAAVTSGGLVSHPQAFAAAQHEEASAAEKLMSLLGGTGLTPPALSEIAEQVGVDLPLARRAMGYLCDEGRAWRASQDLYFDMSAIDECKGKMIDHFGAGGEGTVAALRDLLGITRKYAVPLLESLDQSGFTRRSGDNERRLA